MSGYRKSPGEVAAQIAECLTSGTGEYPLVIDKETYNKLYGLLRTRHPDLRTSILITGSIVECQFSSLSRTVFTITSRHRLTADGFTADCDVEQPSAAPVYWIWALLGDIGLLKFSLIPITGLSGILLIVQSPSDLHSFFSLLLQVLALIFTLYAVLKQSVKFGNRIDIRTFRMGYIGQMYQDERVIGITAVCTIGLCLIDLLVTTESMTKWGADHALVVGPATLSVIRVLSLVIGVLLAVVLTSFLRSLIFYYPDREFGEALLSGKEEWFESQYKKGRQDSKDDEGRLN